MLLLAVLAAGAVIGTVDRAMPGGVYREAVVGQPLSLNPLQAATDPLANDLARLIHAGLVRVTEGGQFEPDLAANWQIADDGRSYAFHLKTGSLWHDGQPLTSADIAATVQFVQSSAYRGPPEVAAVWRRVHVQTPDPATIRFELEEPYAFFLEACSLPALPASVLAEAQVGAEAPPGRLPVGAGPFRVVQLNEEAIQLVRHEGYQGPKPYLDQVQMRFYPDIGQALLALWSGQVDGAIAPNEAAARASDSGDSLALYTLPLLGHQFVLFLNHRNPVLADPRVRQAMAAGVDRDALIARALPGKTTPASGPIPRYSWAYSPEVEGAADAAQAQTLLDGAGWLGGPIRARGGRELRLELATPSDDHILALAEALQAQLQGLGFHVDVHPFETLDFYRERLVPRNYELALGGIWLGSVDPDPYSLWHSSQAATGLNFAGYRSERADALLLEARFSLGQDQRRAALVAFQRVWKEEAPSVVLASPLMTYAISAEIRGVRLGVVPEPSARFQHIAEWYVQSRRLPAFWP